MLKCSAGSKVLNGAIKEDKDITQKLNDLLVPDTATEEIGAILIVSK